MFKEHYFNLILQDSIILKNQNKGGKLLPLIKLQLLSYNVIFNVIINVSSTTGCPRKLSLSLVR